MIDPAVPGPVIICPVGPMVALAARAYKSKKRLVPLEPARAHVFKEGGHRASLVGPCMGAPAAAYTFERVIAQGAKHFIMLGLCGSLSSEVKVGDLVVPSSALIDEGTSPHYVEGAEKSFATDQAVEALRKTLADYGKSYHFGPIWTTDAVFRETKAKVKEYGERGLLAVEMECSALFTIARCRGVELGALLVVSDELSTLTWKPGFARPRFLATLRHAIHIARAAAFRLAGKDLAVEPLPDETEPEED